jgi:Flp pilus assembly protein TadG
MDTQKQLPARAFRPARFLRLKRDQRGVSALEFALIAPILFIMIIGTIQVGLIFYSHTALRSAVSKGARYATIHPRPTAAQVAALVQASRPPALSGTYGDPTVVYQLNASSNTWYATVSMSYSARLNFVLFETPVTLNYSRRANVYEPI